MEINPNEEVSLFICIFTLNLFEADVKSLFLGVDNPSIKIEFIPLSSPPIYFVEIILKD